jgi:hypothetical protein
MEDSKKMIEELKNYLNKNKEKYYESSFSFKGLRKNVPQPDGNIKNLYVISYLVSLDDLQYDSDATYYAYYDEDIKKLLYIIGPQFYKKIQD